MAFGERSFKSQMREANRQGARFVLILGEREAEAGVVAVKDLQSGEQVDIPESSIVAYLIEKIV